jgi:hypothetical protein
MHRESFSSGHGRHDPEPADGNSPLRQVLAAPGGDAGPLACGALANSNVLAGFLAGRSTGRRPVPGTLSREPQGGIDCSELAGDHGNLERRSRRTAPATCRQAVRKVIHDHPRHFPEFLPLASSRRRPAGSRTGAASRRDTGWRRDPGAAPRHDRYGPNPRPLAQIRSNVPRGATRSSTAGYFILHRIKVT